MRTSRRYRCQKNLTLDRLMEMKAQPVRRYHEEDLQFLSVAFLDAPIHRLDVVGFQLIAGRGEYPSPEWPPRRFRQHRRSLQILLERRRAP